MTKQIDPWFYDLPQELIAQKPAQKRDNSRLLLMSALEDRYFSELPLFLQKGDLLVVNDSQVMPARCHFNRISGARVEVLFLEPGPGSVEAMVKPSRKLKEGEILVSHEGQAKLVSRVRDGVWLVETDPSPKLIMEKIGHVPLPPYIQRDDNSEDQDRYQTIFAINEGSSAAPTAGLHFTEQVLNNLKAKEIEITSVTLHVGPGTFQPLRPENIEKGILHEEKFYVNSLTADQIKNTKKNGGRVIAVGTTVTRALEASVKSGFVEPGWGSTRLFIREGYQFKVIDGLLTNFHLPRSSLLMLVAALVGRERLLEAYQHAINKRYRFFSYGDAMLVL